MTPWVKRLLIANVAVFFVQLTVPGATQFLAFLPSYALVRPWSFLTYMFAHSTSQYTHILFNMLVLYFFGPRVEERLGSTHFIRLYLISGVVGALLSIVFNQGGSIIGASGAVFGVQLAFAKYWPRERIYIWGILPVEAWLLVVVTTVIALWGGFAGGGGGARRAAGGVRAGRPGRQDGGGVRSSAGTKFDRKSRSCAVSEPTPFALILSRIRSTSSRFTSWMRVRSMRW